MSIGRGVVLVGPSSPAALADLFTGAARSAAETLPGLGGVPVNSLAKALVHAGADVEVVTLDEQVDEPIALEGAGFRILVGPYRSRARHRARDAYATERRALATLLRRTHGSVVHAHWTYEFALPCLADGRAAVVTAHDTPISGFRLSPSRYRAVRTMVGLVVRTRIRHLSAVSPILADRWRRQMLYRRPISVIPNVVLAPGPALPAPPINPAAPVILDVSEGDGHKNVRALILAFALVLESYPSATLRLVGPALHDRSPLAYWARTAGVATNVEFVGPVGWSSLEPFFQSATIFAHPSIDESFGLTICEAMLAGVPVVAGASAGAVPWVVGDSANLVDIRQPAQIARAILRLLDDPDERARLGRAGAEQVRQRFAPDVVAPKYLEWYEALR